MTTTKQAPRICEICKVQPVTKGSVYCAPCRAADYEKAKTLSAGAMRAGRQLTILTRDAARLAGAAVTGELPESQVEQMAELIDRETGAREMREALERITAEIKGWIGMDRGELTQLLSVTNIRVMESKIAEAEAALRKVEGE